MFDDNVLKKELQNRGLIRDDVDVIFMEGWGGYSLTCEAERKINVSEGKKAKWRSERHLFIFVSNKNTCEALAMLAHEAEHLRQDEGWLAGWGRPREKLETQEALAYAAQCRILYDQECIWCGLSKIREEGVRRGWIRSCINRLKGLSTGKDNLKIIASGCAELVAKQPGGWTAL